LTHARSRVEPAQFPELHGLLANRDPRGRRPPGLTQSHMDLLLGRAPGTYHRLERRAAVRPADLERIGQILNLSEDEWRVAWSYAYAAPPPRPLNSSARRPLPPEWEVALDSLAPAACIQDEEGLILGYNDAFAAYFSGEPVPHSLLRWGLLAPAARHILADWHSQWAPAFCAELRVGLARNKASASLTALMADALTDEVTAELLNSVHESGTSVTPQTSGPRPVRHPELGPGWITLCVASPTDSPGTRLIIAPFHRHYPGSPARIGV
jgi:hypothetical protein